MATILAVEYSHSGEPTNWVWYTLDDDTVVVVSEASDPNFPDMMSGEVTVVGTEDEFAKIQGRNYAKNEIIYATDYYSEPDFEEIFGDEGAEDNYCIVVYDKRVWKKMRERFVRRRGK